MKRRTGFLTPAATPATVRPTSAQTTNNVRKYATWERTASRLETGLLIPSDIAIIEGWHLRISCAVGRFLGPTLGYPFKTAADKPSRHVKSSQ